MNWTTEAKVGASTFFGLVALVAVLVQLSNFVLFGKPGYMIHGAFQTINGLAPGQPVRYAGVEVGRVEDTRVADPQHVDVQMRIYYGTEIPVDSTFSVVAEGIMGERFIEVLPGHSLQMLVAGAQVQGGDPGGVDKIIDDTQKLLVSTQDTVKSVQAIIGDPKMQRAIKATLINAEAVSGQMLVLTASVESLTKQMEAVLERLDGDGQLSADIRELTANAKVTSENARVLSTKMKRLVDGDVFLPGDAEMLYNITKNDASFNANWELDSANSFTRIGAEDIGSGTNINLQYGRRVGNWRGRFGLIRGEAGIGADYMRGDVSITMDAYGFSDTEYRLRTKWDIKDDWALVGQVIRPMNSEYGGNYLGVNHTF